MNSALYECSVMHHRLRPKVHRFSYRVFYLWLDLDELPALDKSLKLLASNRRGLFSIHDSDHLSEPGRLKESILTFMAEGGINTSGIESVCLLTFPRIFGYIFNPVCFYYAFDARGTPVCAVAEVTNTFHEKKRYLVPNVDRSDRFRLTTPKHFYVSPFSDLDVLFDFKLGVPAKSVEIHIDDKDADGTLLLTALTGNRRPLTDGSLLRCAATYPLLTLQVIILIHWHALLLWLKRLPWHRKSVRPELQTYVHPASRPCEPKPH